MNYIQVLPEAFSIISSLVLLLLGIVLSRRVINLLALSCTAATLMILILSVENNEIFFFNSLLKLNLYVKSAQGLILIIGILVLLLLDLSKYDYKYEFSVLVLFALFGMITLVSTNSLISFYLAFELMSISLYILASFNKNSAYSCEAGVKYFTLSSLSSCIMLYGMSLLYGYTGKIDFSQLSLFMQNHQVTYGIVFGLVFVLIGLCFKLAIVPFHMWAPDVYQGAPTIVTMFFSTAPKAALITFLIRLMNEELIDIKSYVQPILLCFSALSVLVSAFGALRQRNLKRLLAYSSIGHVGFMVVSLSIFTQMGINSSLMYLVIYIITSIGLFSCFIQIDDDNCNVANLSGIGKKHPILAFHLSVLLLSMAGMPPLGGFLAKLFIFRSLINSGFIGLSLIFVVAGIVSWYYYLNIIKAIYFDKASSSRVIYSKGLLIITSVASLINIVLFMYVENLYSLIYLVTKGL
ncbi:NADH-quinone oxidoreductase subunit N [Wolbachia endosymbiont of Dirofilaria (Dirofilaria) immitis]|uniref:NADH-quinone oxidoreductase subunit N n=1 Tax=Wolbachia endosymbiont of Dirofilaria (Dirofilaria) immitis TaxID=1812115 RepID=UPI001588D713|nr:NADH-quinone oxidoreductase subunit N [Wolbachia endosymbiont of Dirofilaria (Dirofilaria) immitis]QKX02427.1 NADH-quinone oxidoreductase subunit NuoN [Wolbachia endosymbiont of Dirofilaria (Dirofilaria) immitis]